MKSVLRDKLTFTTTVEIEAQRIEDLLTSAFEGGCGYWLKLKSTDIQEEAKKCGGELNIEKQILYGCKLNCYDAEDIDNKLGELTALQIVAALAAMAKGEDLKGKKNEHLKTHFNNFITENDDATTADVVVQIATMGEIVFG